MGIQRSISTTIHQLSDQNYDRPFTFHRFWFNIAQAHCETPPDQILDAIWDNKVTGVIEFPSCKPIHPTGLLALHFTANAELDSTLAPHSVGLQIR